MFDFLINIAEIFNTVFDSIGNLLLVCVFIFTFLKKTNDVSKLNILVVIHTFMVSTLNFFKNFTNSTCGLFLSTLGLKKASKVNSSAFHFFKKSVITPKKCNQPRAAFLKNLESKQICLYS